jgi:hypothetical protein
MIESDSVITRRASALGSWEVPLVSALLAADTVGDGGFRPADVRFFFLLFTNWMGDDRLRPGADLDPTQVRRALGHLAEQGWARAVSTRPPRWTLAPAGVVQLVDSLTDPRAPRRFEEVVLLAMVARSYADTIAGRVRAGGQGDERRVRSRLDARTILRAERRRLQDALSDLEARRDAGLRMAAAAKAALEAGATPVEVAARLAADGPPYQLHPMRPYEDVLAALPEPLRRFEVLEGPAMRARWMFAPLCEELRARIGILERLEGDVRR